LPRGARFCRPHRRGEPRPLAEAKDFEIEMNLSDLILIEKRLERVKKEKGKASEQALLEKLKAQLDNGLPLRGCRDWTRPTWSPCPGFAS
jgi:ribosome-binding ATPase YchF (GTP1/OBG family)